MYIVYVDKSRDNSVTIECLKFGSSPMRDEKRNYITMADSRFATLYKLLHPFKTKDPLTCKTCKSGLDYNEAVKRGIISFLDHVQGKLVNRTIHSHPELFDERTDALMSKMDALLNKLKKD